jgi:hypothetical protein
MIFKSILFPNYSNPSVCFCVSRSLVTVSENSEIAQVRVIMATNCKRKLCSRAWMSEKDFKWFWRWCITQNYCFFSFSIVWYSREHDVSETGSVSVLRWRWKRRHLQWLRLALSKGPNWVEVYYIWLVTSLGNASSQKLYVEWGVH